MPRFHLNLVTLSRFRELETEIKNGGVFIVKVVPFVWSYFRYSVLLFVYCEARSRQIPEIKMIYSPSLPDQG